MATLARIVGADLPEKAAPDSYDITPVLKGSSYKSPLREVTVQNTYEKIWGLRKGDWLYINHSTGSQREMPASFKKLRNYSDFTTEGLLFDMEKDPEQRVNLYEKYPEKVKEMNQMLQQYRESESTVKR